MDVLEACRARRTVQRFKKSEIDPGLLKQALEAALLAPNHKFTFPWKMLVVGPETRQSLKQIAKDIKRKKKGAAWTEEDERKLDEKLIWKMDNPAALVVFCCARSDDDFRQREDYATVACSIQNFTLVLAAAGYGSKWGSGALTSAPETYELLQVDPDAFEIVGFLWVGHSAEPLPPRKRPPLEQVLETRP